MNELAVSFGEIDRFNAYAAANASTVAELLVAAEGLEDIVRVANGLKFDFGLDDVRAYIRERSQNHLSEEQLAMVAGGGCTYTTTYVYIWAVTVASAVSAVAGAVVTVAVAVLVVVLV